MEKVKDLTVGKQRKGKMVKKRGKGQAVGL